MENNDLLIRLVRNAVSKFEVICEINKRNIEISKNEDFILLKLLLQIDLAKELLSTEDEEQKRRYEDILRNSEGHLKRIESKKRDTSYHCQVSGCTFKHNWYREVLRHLKQNHFGLNQIRCNFKRLCPRVFANIEKLETLENLRLPRPPQLPARHPLHLLGCMHTEQLAAYYNIIL